MTTYNSAQDGNWNTDATWTESGHPTSNDDVMIIGHEVSYDVGASAITWGSVTINSGGVLDFPTDADSTILFNATAILTINDGGELRAGTSTTCINKAYDCKFHFPQGSASRNVLVLNDGGTLNIYGDPDYYGSERYADLDSDWTTGQILYITGNYASKWQAGQKFYIHENKKYVNYKYDGHIYTIATVGSYDSGNDRTPITISEAAPSLTFNAVDETYQSVLVLLSRNVEMTDPESPWDVYGFGTYAEYIKIDNNQAVANNLITFDNVIFRGWDLLFSQYNVISNKAVFVNNKNITSYCGGHLLDGDFISNSAVASANSSCKFTGRFGSNYRILSSDSNSELVGDCIGNNYVNYGAVAAKITGNLISNYYCFIYAANVLVKGDAINNMNVVNSSVNIRIMDGDFRNNGSNTSITSVNTKRSCIFENCMLESTDKRDIRIYQNCGNWLPMVSGDPHWQTPPSTNDWILECIPNSYCNDYNLYGEMLLSPLNPMGVYVESGSNTLTYKVYPVGWTTALDNDDVVLEISYLDSASGITRTDVVNTTATYANGAWRSVSITFTAGQDGIAYVQLYVRKYESGCYLLIDPVSVTT